MSSTTHPGSEHHEAAAEHHESAAHHHREAAKLYDDGEPEKAGHHAHIAHAHGLQAAHHAQEAAKHHAVYHAELDEHEGVGLNRSASLTEAISPSSPAR
jgi:hypothetical protein